jgi:hypothetical protein
MGFDMALKGGSAEFIKNEFELTFFSSYPPKCPPKPLLKRLYIPEPGKPQIHELKAVRMYKHLMHMDSS